jgi:hypothetical protein
MDALDGIDIILSIGAAKLEAIVADTGFKAAVVEAHVVMPGNTVWTVAAALPGLACHTIAYLEEVFRILPEGDHFPGPFMAGNKGIGRRPIAWKPSLDDLRVRSADGHGPDAAENLERTRGGNRHLLDLKLTGPGQNQGLHRSGNG